jgi:hypothetical protein
MCSTREKSYSEPVDRTFMIIRNCKRPIEKPDEQNPITVIVEILLKYNIRTAVRQYPVNRFGTGCLRGEDNCFIVLYWLSQPITRNIGS